METLPESTCSQTDVPDTDLPPLSSLNKPRHVRYWLRCLKTVLPTAYQSNDTQRMSLAFFTLSALDLLDALHEKTTHEERQGYIDWIYGCQHPDGGFRGGTSCTSTAPLETGSAQPTANAWDSANLAATFFALASLLVLEDGLERVRSDECLRWVNSLQRPDGSFGEALGMQDIIEGGGDVRFCYLACGVRHLLRRRNRRREAGQADIDVEALVGYIMRSVTYEGGIAKAPLHEAHAGETFCGIAALELLNRLPGTGSDVSGTIPGGTVDTHFISNVTRWLVYRQTLYMHPEDDEGPIEDGDEGHDVQNEKTPQSAFHVMQSRPAKTEDIRPPTTVKLSARNLLWAGFNGRCNKVADTCYAWWVAGSLRILKTPHVQNFNAIERYLLDKTQHMIGGFSKTPGDPPDILHSYLGLAALAVMRHPDLRSIDATFCISKSAKEKFEQNATNGERDSSIGLSR